MVSKKSWETCGYLPYLSEMIPCNCVVQAKETEFMMALLSRFIPVLHYLIIREGSFDTSVTKHGADVSNMATNWTKLPK